MRGDGPPVKVSVFTEGFSGGGESVEQDEIPL